MDATGCRHRDGIIHARAGSDLFYEDHPSDYVTNEPAIDFAAPLVYVLADLLEPR
jgi:hypothetical protein